MVSTVSSYRSWRPILLLIFAALAAGAAAASWFLVLRPREAMHAPATRLLGAPSSTPGDTPADSEDDASLITFPRASWRAAAIEIRPVTTAALEQVTTLTGKITLNEDRVAHIYPLVDGRVDEVNVSLGDPVTKGQPMAVIQSREVGQAMLQLAQDRLQLSFAQRKDAWMQSVATNTQALIDMIRADTPVEEIETGLRNRPLGEYRDTLMSAYIAQFTSRRNLERLTPLRTEGLVAARQIFEAEAAWTTARATLQSLLEQIEEDARQAAVMSAQTVQELQTRVIVDETALEILGIDRTTIATIDPAKGASLAHCPIHAPFDGTVISKDVVLLEHVGPTNQILGVADLSTVWLTADVYEEHLRLLHRIENQPVTFRTNAWPGRVFEARIFYTGDLVDRETRTVSLRAVADNAERLLKPGMFVTVDLPAVAGDTVLQVPLPAVQEHEGSSFVFVHVADDMFERRDVRLGRRNPEAVEILAGLAPGDQVVVSGGFALKSQMLAELLAE